MHMCQLCFAHGECDTMAKNQNNNVAPATQKTDPGAKKDALATALAQIEKQFGKGAVMKLGDNAAMQVDAISTGSIGLDLALGVGGVPRGQKFRLGSCLSQ